jgi:hypothetical protein
VYFDNDPYTPDNQFPRPIVNQDGGLFWILSDSNVSFDGQSSFFPEFVKYGSIRSWELIVWGVWVIIEIHTLFCYYAIKRQISTKLIGENMFCIKAHQLSIVLPSKSRLVQLRIYTCYTKRIDICSPVLFITTM